MITLLTLLLKWIAQAPLITFLVFGINYLTGLEGWDLFLLSFLVLILYTTADYLDV